MPGTGPDDRRARHGQAGSDPGPKQRRSWGALYDGVPVRPYGPVAGSPVGRWLAISTADLSLVRKPGGLGPARPVLVSRLKSAWSPVLAGDEPGAWAVVEAALASGMGPDSLLLEVVAPALRSVGERWANAQLTVADEHVATVVTARVIGRLGARFARRGVRRGTVLLACPAGSATPSRWPWAPTFCVGRALTLSSSAPTRPPTRWHPPPANGRPGGRGTGVHLERYL